MNILTPKDILNITSKIKYDNFTSEEKYIIKSPDDILQFKKGICYDVVELERELFTKIKYKFKTYFFFSKLPIEDNPTHTVLIYQENYKFYWFESSWDSYRGIHGPFTSYIDAINFVMDKLKIDWKTCHVIEYNKFNYSKMNVNQFARYILNHF